MAVAIIYESREPVVVDAVADGDELWVGRSELRQASGWDLKPEGLCRDHVCVPIPHDREGEFLMPDGDHVNLSAFARLRGQPVVHEETGRAWAFGYAADQRETANSSLEAPDFTLPDAEGVEHTLSDFRGRKVLLLAWASWCGCRYDLPYWQALYEELEDENFVLISIATDGGGAGAAAEWITAARATHPALIDEWHTTTDMYGFVNVPNTVWIDEDGQIVRPAEAASTLDVREIDRETLAISPEAAARSDQAREQYFDAIRDWVRTGRQALEPGSARRRVRESTEATAAAAAHHRLGTYLLREGRQDVAQHHFAEALRLDPDRWTYRRDAWGQADDRIEGSTPVSAQGRHAAAFWSAVEDLGERPFYPPSAPLNSSEVHETSA